MRRLTLAFLLLGAAPAFAADLTLKRVMLSSAGVGYFEYEAEVDGPTTLGLDVPLDQVDDVLTSLVVFDSAGGVGTVELPGRDTTRASFGDVPFGPEALRSTVDYLNSLQGVEIAVQGPRPMTGRLVHAERVAEALPAAPGQPPATVQRTRVTLLGADGMRQFVLEDADSIQVTDPALSARIGQALDSLRREANQSVRHITLRSTGAGQRTVRVGYVAAAPLWKAIVPAGAAGDGRRAGAPAGLGGAGEPVERQLGRRRAHPAVRQPGHVPAGDLSELFRAAAGGAGGNPRPHPAQRRYARPTGRDRGGAEGRSLAPPAGAAWLRRGRSGAGACRRHGAARRAGAGRGKRGGDDLPASRRRSCWPPAIPPACRSSTASFPPNASTSPPATIRIRCPRSGSPTTPAPRCRPAC